LFANTHNVSKAGGHITPFTAWANAATNIHAAVDAASSGDTVLVNYGRTIYHPNYCYKKYKLKMPMASKILLIA